MALHRVQSFLISYFEDFRDYFLAHEAKVPLIGTTA